MKIATWNVNSVRARQGRLLAWLDRRKPDIVCLQELKVAEEAFPGIETKALGYHAAVLGQRTYNGVAILSLPPIEDVWVGLDERGESADAEARLIHGRVAGVHILSAYFPNGQEVGSDKYRYKLGWMERLATTLGRRFDLAKDPVLLCGDFNVAPFDDDMARPAEFRNTVLATDEVRAALARIRDLGFRDVVRPFHPRGGVYTWWDYRGRGFERGNGLRIDHVYATEAAAKRVIGATVDRDERAGDDPSDHAPVVIELEE